MTHLRYAPRGDDGRTRGGDAAFLSRTREGIREPSRRLVVMDLGRRAYGEVWELQRRLVEERIAGARPDTLVLCEHEHVITVGRRAGARANVLDAGEVPVFEVERGGDVTYHGPGQLVGYPILRLEEGERDVHRLLRGLEEALIVAVRASVGLATERRPGFTGVWRGGRKLASIGVAVREWVTYHGFALNVATDLGYFKRLNPCGLPAEVMSSLAAEAGRPVDGGAVRTAVARAVAEVFGRRLA